MMYRCSAVGDRLRRGAQFYLIVIFRGRYAARRRSQEPLTCFTRASSRLSVPLRTSKPCSSFRYAALQQYKAVNQVVLAELRVPLLQRGLRLPWLASGTGGTWGCIQLGRPLPGSPSAGAHCEPGGRLATAPGAVLPAFSSYYPQVRRCHRPQTFRESLASVCHMKPVTSKQRMVRRSAPARDVKPENLVIMADGTMKLADFGLAIDTSLDTPVCRLGTLARPFRSPPRRAASSAPLSFSRSVTRAAAENLRCACTHRDAAKHAEGRHNPHRPQEPLGSNRF